jgi:hypothetical protein
MIVRHGKMPQVSSVPFALLLIFFALILPSEAAAADWYAAERTPELAAVIICAAAVLVSVYLARGRRFYVRPLPGVQAIDDALGRATEMGAPVMYLTGWGGDLARPTTMASLTILSHVARRTAAFGTPLLFPSHDPVVASAAQDTIQQGYAAGKRPELYNSSDVAFVTQSQLGYAAAVDGIMSRRKPGAVFLLGSFEGEALILAETAHNVGAVQISGTDSTIQLSFFLVACDYTLIGEELFAASGYLSGDPLILGAVRGQDVLKIIIVTVLLIGAVLGLFQIHVLAEWLG